MVGTLDSPIDLDQVNGFIDQAARTLPMGAGLRGGGLETIVFCGGCFDWLHWGHVDFLQRARSLGTKLVVGLNSDNSIKALKGGDRPLLPFAYRRGTLLALRSVTEVLPMEEPASLILRLRPHIVVKGPGYKAETMPERHAAEKVGARIVILDGPPMSTTSLLEKINAAGSCPG